MTEDEGAPQKRAPEIYIGPLGEQQLLKAHPQLKHLDRQQRPKDPPPKKLSEQQRPKEVPSQKPPPKDQPPKKS